MRVIFAWKFGCTCWVFGWKLGCLEVVMSRFEACDDDPGVFVVRGDGGALIWW